MRAFLTAFVLLTFATAISRADVTGSGDKTRRRVRRDTVGFTSRRWPEGVVPFQFLITTGLQTRAVFRLAIEVIQKVSCVRFVERTYQRDYVRIITGTGCYSLIGREGGAQYLSLGEGCYKRGIAIHEIMHLLGFFHEQSRPDRDQHVKIHPDNMIDSAKRQFKKYRPWNGDDLGAEYDPDSIMHYSNQAYSKNGKNTITYQKDEAKVLGQREKMSDTDIYQLNKLYGCDGKKETPNKPCRDDAWAAFSGECIFHLFLGNCYRQRKKMQQLCPQTCGFCRSTCYDTSEYCTAFALYGYCQKNKTVQKRCKKTCKKC